jgi:serine/threonine protein kinase
MRERLKAFQRYTLKRKLGQGGMGVVWLAHDGERELDVALKFLPEALVHDEECIADLKRETRRCMQLTHPNIVRVHDFLRGDDMAAVSMEHVDGKTLQSLKLEQPERCFSAAQLTPWLERWCRRCATRMRLSASCAGT